MKNLILIKERYLKEPLPQRIGALAANLTRLASFSQNLENKKVVESLLEESKFFIEWIVPETSIKMQVLLVQMQVKLSLWQRNWRKNRLPLLTLKELQKTAQHWSDYLIKASGLLSK